MAKNVKVEPEYSNEVNLDEFIKFSEYENQLNLVNSPPTFFTNLNKDAQSEIKELIGTGPLYSIDVIKKYNQDVTDEQLKELTDFFEQQDALESQIHIMQLVVDYLEYHKGIKPRPISKPLKKNKDFKDNVADEWDSTYIDEIFKKKQTQLFELIQAAENMGCEPLMDLGCAKIAFMIKNLKWAVTKCDKAVLAISIILFFASIVFFVYIQYQMKQKKTLEIIAIVWIIIFFVLSAGVYIWRWKLEKPWCCQKLLIH